MLLSLRPMQNYWVATSLSYNDLDAHDLLWNQEGWYIKCGIDFKTVKKQIMELNDLIMALAKNSFGLKDEKIDSGHDLFQPIRNDFVNRFGDIDKVDLSIKLKFLEKHGFNLIVDSVDRKLRNDISHLNFRVLADGKIVDK
jgi:hypothetical protein